MRALTVSLAVSLAFLAHPAQGVEPVLSTPQRVAPAAGFNTKPLSPPPAVEVSGSSGSIRLTARILTTTLKVGDKLWAQLEYKNIGSTVIPVMDSLFEGDGLEEEFLDDLATGFWNSRGAHFVIIGPDGKRLPYGRENLRDYCYLKPETGDLARDLWGEPRDATPGELAVIEKAEAEAKRAGMDERGRRRLVQDALARYWKTVPNPRRIPRRRLNPGESAVSRPWPHPLACVPDYGDLKVRPRDGYMRFGGFRFEKPGRYRLRAVYDMTPDAWDIEWGLKRHPEDVRLETPWVILKVTR